MSKDKVGEGLEVSDMEKAREFYKGKLGLSVSIGSGNNVQYQCGEGGVMHIDLSPSVLVIQRRSWPAGASTTSSGPSENSPREA